FLRARVQSDILSKRVSVRVVESPPYVIPHIGEAVAFVPDIAPHLFQSGIGSEGRTEDRKLFHPRWDPLDCPKIGIRPRPPVGSPDAPRDYIDFIDVPKLYEVPQEPPAGFQAQRNGLHLNRKPGSDFEF